MATLVSLRDTPGARVGRDRRVPWSPHAWSETLYLAGGIPAQFAVPLIALAVWGAFHPKTLPMLLVVLVVAAATAPLLTRVQRYRMRVTAGVVIPRQAASGRRLSLPGIVAAVRSPATWRQLGYHLLAGPALAVAAAAAVWTWLAGIVCTLV